MSSLRNAKTKIEDKMERRERAKKREQDRFNRDNPAVDAGNKREVRSNKTGGGEEEGGGSRSSSGGPAPPSAPPSGKKKRGKKRGT